MARTSARQARGVHVSRNLKHLRLGAENRPTSLQISRPFTSRGSGQSALRASLRRPVDTKTGLTGGHRDEQHGLDELDVQVQYMYRCLESQALRHDGLYDNFGREDSRR